MIETEAAMNSPIKTVLTLFLTSGLCFSADWISALQQARTALNRGQFVNAEQILNSTIDQIQAKSGHNAPALDEPLDLLAQAYRGEKRLADAATTEQRRIDIWTRVFGENAVIVGRILGQLAMIERQAGDLAGAETDARRALTIMTAAYLDKPAVAQAAIDVADILLAENRGEDAGQMLAMAQNMYEASLGPQSMLALGVAARRAKQPAPSAETTGVYHAGGQVSAPRIQSKVEPQYAEEARKNKLQGTIMVSFVVDATGTATQIAVLRPLGFGLDEKAIGAVSQWKFSPGTKDGTPVAIQTQAEVTFRLL
jgi:TonB family protein